MQATDEPQTPSSKGFGSEIFKIFGGGGSGSAPSANAQKKATRGEHFCSSVDLTRLTRVQMANSRNAVAPNRIASLP